MRSWGALRELWRLASDGNAQVIRRPLQHRGPGDIAPADAFSQITSFGYRFMSTLLVHHAALPNVR